VLSFTGGPDAPGDLVAVNPETGEERVLVEDLDEVSSASWSADGRWVAYEAPVSQGIGLWVVSASQEPRRVATGVSMLMLAWSSTGAELATIRPTSSFPTTLAGSTLSTIDPRTGGTTVVGSIPGPVGDDGSIFGRIGDVTSAPAWSPDGTRFAFGARGGAIYSVDVRSGTHSLLARLPGENLDSVDQIVWSPDGTRIAIMNDGKPGGVYVIDADGSNVRVLLDDRSDTRLAWSPDGARLAYQDGSGAIWVAPMDGSAPTELGTPLPASNDSSLLYQSDITWSPDGSQVAFRYVGFLGDGDESVDVSAFDADGSGEAERIDELTFLSWAGGSYSYESA
jgi:Tol biopolymer transport system component